MKQSVGCDIEEVKRFENKSQSFLDKIFTRAEQDYCLSKAKPSQHFAVRFCAKESVVKALTSLGFSAPSYRDIEIVNNESGAPEVCLRVGYETPVSFSLSLSHSRTNALACVLATANQTF